MLQLMMGKSVLAALAVTSVTAVNLGVLIRLGGHEQGWLFLTTCCVDVAWSVVVIHWLTSNPLVNYETAGLELDAVRATVVSPPSPRVPVDDSEARRFWRQL